MFLVGAEGLRRLRHYLALLVLTPLLIFKFGRSSFILVVIEYTAPLLDDRRVVVLAVAFFNLFDALRLVGGLLFEHKVS